MRTVTLPSADSPTLSAEQPEKEVNATAVASTAHPAVAMAIIDFGILSDFRIRRRKRRAWSKHN
jgi:hypothetical protein